ncbi:MAG: hypothetical protein LBT42_02620 [Tannerella sp.]|jgi:hypothetical protein|nr:hypothetical protein [Tannerella sp.]
MKIRTYLYPVFAAALFLFAGTDKAGLTTGFRQGYIAPAIKLLEDDGIKFANSSGRYTLLHFWAAYDANSRMQNVRLWNKLLPNIDMVSVSMDELPSVFVGTVKADRLEATKQLHENNGERSEAYKKYGLKKGLRNFLIDDKGVVVAEDVNFEQLSAILKRKQSLE